MLPNISDNWQLLAEGPILIGLPDICHLHSTDMIVFHFCSFSMTG